MILNACHTRKRHPGMTHIIMSNPLKQHDYENYDYERECNQQREKY